MANSISADIPAGDLQLYDNYIPPLEAGNYFITVQQTLKNGAAVITDKLGMQQEFVVAAPQFAIDTTQVVNMYPPAGSTGLYGEVLPHIVLKDPMLPWERQMQGTKSPWLALMVFDETELLGGDDPDTKTNQTTVAGFLGLQSPVLAPKPELEDDVDPTSSCKYIKIPAAVFQSIVPRLDELRYLAHVRKVNTGNRALMGLNEHGLFSVIASNRFASAPPTPAKTMKNIVHLVSLEGMENYLAANADLSQYTGGVALVSLASWSFLSLPDQAQDFRALAENLVHQETTTSKTIDPKLLWLRLPPPSSGSGNVMTEVTKRINNGYVPLAYHTRSGENSFAWYRGPLAPLLAKPMTKRTPFFTADSALIYDKNYGVFDVSLAAAWEAGREAALADPYFGQHLLALRKKAHGLIDSLQYKLTSDHFTAKQIEELEATTTVQDAFLSLLTPQLVKDIGDTAKTAMKSNPPLAEPPPPADPIEEAKKFLSDTKVQDRLKQIIAEDMAPVAEWLGTLMLLYPFPFDKLVPDERLLPVESLRFFYLDTNWLSAAIDGALSLGLDSSRQTFFTQVTKNMISNAAMQALAVMRDKLEGKETEKNPVPPAVMSGCLLRSALVTGWPNLVIKAKDVKDTSLRILRMDHLSSSVLLCIFDGVPNNVEFSEPQESLGFGVDQDGNVVLRNILATGTAGQQIGTLQVRDLTNKQKLCMRAAGSKVLNIAPTDTNGLVQSLIAGLKKSGSAPPGDKLGPSTFAIQMIKSAEAIVFSSQTS